MEATGISVALSSTLMVSLLVFAMYRRVPAGLIAMPLGNWPVGAVASTCRLRHR